MSYDLAKLQKKMKKHLDADRYSHTLGVMYTAASMAMCYGEDLERTMVAGVLHDCAKCIPNDEKVALCKEYGIPISSAEKATPHLLHAKLGAYLAEHKYGVHDPGIINAIKYHTTGKPGMTRLEKIIFVADFIEPGRMKAPRLFEIRQKAFDNLDEAVYLTLWDTLSYLRQSDESLDPQSEEAYQYYRDLLHKKKEAF